MKFIFYLLLFIIVSSADIVSNNENSQNITQPSVMNDTETIIEPEPKLILLFQKKLRNLDNKAYKFKIVTSYKKGPNDSFVEIVTKEEYINTPISSTLYRMPDKIKLTPKEFIDVIEFLASNISAKQKYISIGLKITRFDNPYFVTLIKPVGWYSLTYKIQVFDWAEIKDLLSIASNILFGI